MNVLHVLFTLLAFAVAIGVLVAVHEWGHYRMAVACGVRVLRFCVGFGPIVLRYQPRRQHPGQSTEFALAAIPFGGYVKMLDEREEAVPEALKPHAFNNQSLKVRALIAAAGPAANLLLAVALYTLVNWLGVQEPRAVLAPPAEHSLAQRAGVQGGDVVVQAALQGRAPQTVASFESLRWLLMQGALDGHDVTLELVPDAQHESSAARRRVVLPLTQLQAREADARMMQEIGILAPRSKPVMGEILPGDAAERAGLQAGDEVISIDGQPIHDGEQLRHWVRQYALADDPPAGLWQLRRSDELLNLEVRPEIVLEEDVPVGRIGAYIGSAPDMVLVRKGPIEGVWQAFVRTWEVSSLSLRLLGRMLVGDVSLRNVSGPVAIASYAGQSASMGPVYFLGFLAFISVSLGILNLLPIPVLDGGHLLYYLWEALTGKAVEGVWLERLQYIGMCFLLALMMLAVFNDVTTLWG